MYMQENIKKKNGLHDFTENKYRELSTVLRLDGFDALIEYLLKFPVLTFKEYEKNIPERNIFLKNEIKELYETNTDKIVSLDEIVHSINTTKDEKTMLLYLNKLKELSNN